MRGAFATGTKPGGALPRGRTDANLLVGGVGVSATAGELSRMQMGARMRGVGGIGGLRGKDVIDGLMEAPMWANGRNVASTCMQASHEARILYTS
jgi:hypothetical protein